MDTEVGKNLPARILYLKKKVNKETFYVSSGYNVDKSTHRLKRLVASFIIVSNSFMSLSFQERPRDFGEETSSHLEIYGRKPLAYMNGGSNLTR